MTRLELIQSLIDKHGYKSYLEIGVNTPAQPGFVHDSIKVETKHGVDPNVDTDFRMTSDEFFKGITESSHDIKYDLIFIDGLHLWEQVVRDIENSLKILNEGGRIVVHDTNPIEEATQRRERITDAWHGDVWKAIVQMRLRDDIYAETIDTDEGCTIIRKRPPTSSITAFYFLNENREGLLNLKSVSQWKRENL